MARSGNRIVAFDIGSSSVKAARFSRNPLTFEAFSSAKYAPSDGDLAAAIAEALVGVGTGGLSFRECVAVVSGQSVFSRIVRLPPVDKDKVYQIILYEAQQNVPFLIDEVVWDYRVVSRGGEMDCVIAAVKKDIAVRITEAFKANGLKLSFLGLAPLAVAEAARPALAGEGTTLVADVGARSTDLTFIDGVQTFMRSVPVAGDAITQQIQREFVLGFEDAETMKLVHVGNVSLVGELPTQEAPDKVTRAARSVMTRVHAEMNRSVNFFRSQQDGAPLKRVLLTGGSSIIDGLDTMLGHKMGVEVDHLNPLADVPAADGVKAEDVGRSSQFLAALVGAAKLADRGESPLNLLPEQDSALKRMDKAFLSFLRDVGPSLLPSVIMLAAFGYVFSKIMQRPGLDVWDFLCDISAVLVGYALGRSGRR